MSMCRVRLWSLFLRHAALIFALANLPAAAGCEFLPIGDPSTDDEDEGEDESTADQDGVPDSSFCAEAKVWSAKAAKLEEEILVIVNERRKDGADCGSEGTFEPALPLRMNATLRCAARVHSLDMVGRDFFDHENPDGDGPTERIMRAGFEGNTWGENIAAGYPTAQATMKQWMESDGHCANVMRPEFREIGVGYVEGSMYNYVWTQAFGG